MSDRKLMTGAIAKEYPSVTDLSVHTKCPSKWLLIDQENGRIYQGNAENGGYGHWIWINKGDSN